MFLRFYLLLFFFFRSVGRSPCRVNRLVLRVCVLHCFSVFLFVACSVCFSFSCSMFSLFFFFFRFFRGRGEGCLVSVGGDRGGLVLLGWGVVLVSLGLFFVRCVFVVGEVWVFFLKEVWVCFFVGSPCLERERSEHD